MPRSFIIPGAGYEAKAAPVAFLILKNIYLLAGSFIIYSVGWTVFFASTKIP